ncbi:hypothetical protein H6P81_021231 [Aristolochia fimbriata]|uniref:Uncharacterized protein n=1 Tax=Aristolochia fimbriata TaxID=158543 RepID=A0AAV7DT50_ARIFI|nr:hypothetical protein H6P81_021231 [Aristolochia fimbriata]
MPPGRRALAGCVNARQSSRQASRPGADGIPRTIEVFERKLHPRPLGQGYTCLGATPTQPPPHPASPCCPTAGGAGGSPGRSRLVALAPPGAGWLKTLCPKGTSHDESGGSGLPPPGAGSSRGPRPRLKRTPAAGSCLRGPEALLGFGTPVRRSRPSRRTGRKSHGWGAREGDSPVVPDPAATARRCRRSRVVWECSPNRAVNSGPRLNSGGETDSLTRKRMGPGDALGQSADGRAGPAADSGADRRWSRATQARRMIPPADTPPLADRGGWRYDSRTRSRGHLRAPLAPGQLVPHSPALKHGPRSPTCVRSQRATKPVRRKEADWRDPLAGCTADPPRSSGEGFECEHTCRDPKMVNYA